jgi:hypothetical protein
MRRHRWAIPGSWAVLLSACSVPVERFARADAAELDDGAQASDASEASDASDASDASEPPVFMPIHVEPATMIPGAPDLIVRTGPMVIDTSALTIAGQTSPFFVRQGAYAVLFAGVLTVEDAVTITGTVPLIAVASGAITVAARIDLSAVGAVAGPGAATDNEGAGGDGQTRFIPEPVNVRLTSGGGGGGYGTPGGSGGGSSMLEPGSPGVTYGLQPGDRLIGGGRGGQGGCGPLCASGGAGGGALQLSSATSITVAPSGVITAAGGRGRGGGGAPAGGGGGGAGGEILLEAPLIVVAGVLAANGGGGGGGGGNGGPSVPQGLDGEDGRDSAAPASGGAGGIPMGADGGAGAAGVAGAFTEAAGGRGGSEAGGGGGGAGRIWLRYRATNPVDRSSATISPPPGLDDTLP